MRSRIWLVFTYMDGELMVTTPRRHRIVAAAAAAVCMAATLSGCSSNANSTPDPKATGPLNVWVRGAGDSSKAYQAIFDKFTSVERERGLPVRGFGLGLHLVSLVARAHRGTVSVRDREGGGSVFAIELPLC